MFALVVAACQQGHFEWAEFQQLLIAELRASALAGESHGYYLNWSRAAEKLFAAKGVLELQAVDQRVARLRPDDRTVRLR